MISAWLALFTFQRGQRRTLQDLEIMNSQTGARPELISLDFWESYDPDEVCNAGFSLVGFDPFNLKPVCFLCGSAGTKKVGLVFLTIIQNAKSLKFISLAVIIILMTFYFCLLFSSFIVPPVVNHITNSV